MIILLALYNLGTSREAFTFTVSYNLVDDIADYDGSAKTCVIVTH